MGQLDARLLAMEGHKVYGCDLPEKNELLRRSLSGTGVQVLDNGFDVAQKADLLIYAVETENIGRVVEQYGPATKKGAVVTGQTSVKTPEIEAFEKHLPSNCYIVTYHRLHNATLNPKGQTTVAINHNAPEEIYSKTVETIQLGSNIVELPTYHDHDMITADTQVVTHLGLASMGTAWKNAGFFPWHNASYSGGIDTIKVLSMLRFYAGKAHVPAGLAIFNPFARQQVQQYAQSVSELFKLAINDKEREFRDRIHHAHDRVLAGNPHLLLDHNVVEQFKLGDGKSDQTKPNSHLSLLAMVDAWSTLGVNPYHHYLCTTPQFSLRLGIVEWLFRDYKILQESIDAALNDLTIRGDDLEFVIASREWASIIGNGDIKGYEAKFDETKEFFREKLEEGKQISGNLIKELRKCF